MMGQRRRPQFVVIDNKMHDFRPVNRMTDIPNDVWDAVMILGTEITGGAPVLDYGNLVRCSLHVDI